ncbi:hypothetical protein BH20ACT4_BH20ACT4_03390 [soil metagenome]
MPPGVAAFPAERIPHDTLWAKVVFTGQPHARLLALDTTAARAVPGVLAVITAADVPVNEYGLTIFDQPALIGPPNGRSDVVPDVSRWEADQLAVVVAETLDAAGRGAKGLEPVWEQLPVVADLDDALAGNTLVHPEDGTGSNVYCSLKIRKGDVDAGFAAADVVVEGTYEVPYQEHAYLQPEAAVSYIDDEGRVTVEVAGQWTHEDRDQIAHALDLRVEQVRVIYPAIGGAFGGREDMSVQIVMALAAQTLAAQGEHRPIAVYTNAVPGGAFRGFGAPQGIFVAESQMNKLASVLGLDPVELRRRNVVRDGSIGTTQTPMPEGVTMPAVLESCAAASHWNEPLTAAEPFSPFTSLRPVERALRRGRGVACAFKNVGFSFGFPERCEATIVLHGDGDDPERAELFHAGADVGQGAHTVFVQMASEATGLPAEAVVATFSDTAVTGDSGSASASRLTWMAGNSILGAAEEADKAWRDGQRPAVGRFRYVPPPTEALDPDTGVCVPNFSYGYTAQVVEVTVDVETGHIVVDRVISSPDVRTGRPLQNVKARLGSQS